MLDFNTFSYHILSEHLDSKLAGLALGITFGDKTHIDRNLYENMRIIGATHLLVLSGGNIAMLGGFLTNILTFIPLKIRQGIVICTILLFISLIPTQGSVIRATIMYIIPQVGMIIGKQSNKMYTLFLTCIVMLLWNVNYLNDISFQLSFAALFGIIAFERKARVLTSKRNIINIFTSQIYSQIHLGISAQVFVLPLVFYYFNSISVLATLSTIVLSVVVAPIMVCTIIIMWIRLPIPELLWLPNGALYVFLTYFENLASTLSKFKFLYLTY